MSCGFTDVIFNGTEYVCSKCGKPLGKDFIKEAKLTLGIKYFNKINKLRREINEIPPTN